MNRGTIVSRQSNAHSRTTPAEMTIERAQVDVAIR